MLQQSATGAETNCRAEFAARILQIGIKEIETTGPAQRANGKLELERETAEQDTKYYRLSWRIPRTRSATFQLGPEYERKALQNGTNLEPELGAWLQTARGGKKAPKSL